MKKIAGTVMFCLCMTCCIDSKLGAQEMKSALLAPCPGSPNCVSTQAADEKHHMDPIGYTGPMEQAKQRLLKVIGSLKRARVMTDDGDYIHVVFTSLIFRFKDDVEFAFDDQKKIVNFRSASRMGYSDLGVNRKRMEEIRKRFEETR